MDAALAKVSARELYERTGIQLMPINTVFELAAMAAEHDPALEAAETLLMIPDLMHYWLSGAGSPSTRTRRRRSASTRTRGPGRDDLLERLGIPTALLPEVVPPRRFSRRSRRVPRRPGSKEPSWWRARRTTQPRRSRRSRCGQGSAFISAGTWSLVGLELPRPVIDDRTYAANLTNEGGVAGTVRVLRNVTGLWLLHECRRAWALEGFDRSFEELVDLAASAPQLRSLIDPNRPGLRRAGRHAAENPRVLRETGQPEPEDAGAVVRCVLESLAVKHAQTLDLLPMRPASSCVRCTSSAAARATTALPVDRGCVRPSRARGARRGDRGGKPARPGARARRARLDRRMHATSSASRSSRRSYEPAEVELLA